MPVRIEIHGFQSREAFRKRLGRLYRQPLKQWATRHEHVSRSASVAQLDTDGYRCYATCMRASMNISLPESMKAWVDQQVAAGGGWPGQVNVWHGQGPPLDDVHFAMALLGGLCPCWALEALLAGVVAQAHGQSPRRGVGGCSRRIGAGLVRATRCPAHPPARIATVPPFSSIWGRRLTA